MTSIILKNLKPENIRAGVKILKTVGTFEAGPGILNEDITVDSSTVEQQFQAGEGYTGLGTVTVNPYVLDSKTVDSSTVSQTVTSDEDGLSSVTVNPYTLDTKTVDSSTVSQTVNSSADGMSSVTVNPYTLEAKTVDASVSAQTITPSTADGLSSVTVNAVTSSIDSNISSANIKQGVTILGVTGTLSSDSDWILDAKGGVSNSIDVNSGMYETENGLLSMFENSQVTSVTFRDPYVSGNYAFKNTFYGVTSLSSASFPNLATVSGTDSMKSFTEISSGRYNCTVSLPNLATVSGSSSMAGMFAHHCSGDVVLPELLEVSGTSCLSNFIIGSNATSFSMPKLQRITGVYQFRGACAEMSSLASISMPNLLYKDGGGMAIFNEFISRSASSAVTTTPEFFKYNSASGEYFTSSSSSAFSDITLTIPDNYTYANGWNNTSGNTTYICFNHLHTGAADSTILHILRQLGNVTDYDQVHYTVVFNTRTITDNANFDYTTAYNKLIDAGWTINNLTIDAPKFIEVTSGSSLNLKNADTITFDALYGWTASVDDPSIGLSAYSGNAGSSQSVTVTMDPNWEGSATVTFSCSDGTFTQTDSVTVIYSNSNYIRLSYVDVGGNGTGKGDTGVTLTAASKMQLDFMSLDYRGGVIVSTDSRDGLTNEWRVFGYSGSMYFDLGGGGNNSRLIAGGWCSNNVRYNYEFGKYYITNLNTSETTSGYSTNTFTSTSPDTMKIGGESDTARIYELKFYVDGTNLSHYFVPAKDFNNVVGFWDMINDTFVTPATGTWSGGSPV